MSSTSTIIPSYLLPSLPGIWHFHLANRITLYPVPATEFQPRLPLLLPQTLCPDISVKSENNKAEKGGGERQKSVSGSCGNSQSLCWWRLCCEQGTLCHSWVWVLLFPPWVNLGRVSPTTAHKEEEGTRTPVSSARRAAGKCCTPWHCTGWEGSDPKCCFTSPGYFTSIKKHKTNSDVFEHHLQNCLCQLKRTGQIQQPHGQL